MDSTRPRPAPALAPLPASLPAGTLIAGRFTLLAPAGRGGMGTVYRASDALTGQSVALKLLHADTPEAFQRFSREAQVLASLRHPGIVSYVAHGAWQNGRPFLAMQWLEGEDLAHRLARQPLSLAESLALLRSAAQALAVAHQHGVIHRDLKPSNLFLRQGHPHDVVLLDFGLARHTVPSMAMTASQMVVGTPGYMAPEQASSQSQLTPSADIFSLGCVLYECLTGQPPFSAPHFVAALAKILFTEPAPLRSVRPELPEALQELLQRMLVKDPGQRLLDASHLLTALEPLRAELGPGLTPAALSEAPLPNLADAEQQLVSVLLAAPRSTSSEATNPQGSRLALRDAMRALLSPHGAQVELLADGSLVLTLVASHGSATDPAALAARCALILQQRWPEAAVVLTTGRGRLNPHLPVGEAMDRAGQLLRQVEVLPASTSPSASVLLDEVTAGLLGPGFQLSRPRSGLFLLHGESLGADESRPLLGKPTPCVGREQELALLELTFNTCLQESVAQAVLVTAPAGMGKSRLRHEFLRRVERHTPRALVLMGRGDPMSAGSAQGLLGQALRRLCGISGVEPLEERRARLAQRIAQHLPEPQALAVAGFLGELCGIPFPDEHSPRLRTARGDPHLLSAQVSRSLVAFLLAECAHQPVLLVLEDLHWGDVLSLRLLEEALRELAEQPFMVLALARPEVVQLFPGAWTRRVQEVPLRGLNRKAGARLVHEVLGPQVPEALIHQLVEQAAGNPLFLEELIRAVAEGRGEQAPRTVLAMLQARLGRLEAGARQALLAASLFGRTFWAGGVSALLGAEAPSSHLEHHLQQLTALEMIERQPTSRFPGQSEYRFRHALVRDAAYGLVPDSHKPGGHRLVGQWLEQRGENDPRVLAEHARLAEQPERAIHYYTLAAEQLLDRHDLQGLQGCLEVALALGPHEEQEVRLRALQATAAFWLDDFATAYQLGNAVLPRLKAGSARWCKLFDGLCMGFGLGARKEQLRSLYQLLLDTEPEPEARGAFHLSLCFMGSMSYYLGAVREADACFQRLEHTGQAVIAQDGMVRGWRNVVYSFRALYLTQGPWQALSWAEQAAQATEDAGSERLMVPARVRMAQALLALGDTAGALERARQGMGVALRVSQRFGISFAHRCLALVLAASSEPAHQQEARELALQWVEAPGANRMHLGTAHLVLTRLAAAGGQLAEAEAQARKAREVLAPFVPVAAEARWRLGAVLLSQGRAAEARQEVELTLRELEALGPGGVAQIGLLQVLAEACFALGDTAAGEQALRSAVLRVRSRAVEIPETALRERFLLQVPENARVLELARHRWGQAEGA
jgi:serine/threonine protein kinase/tetratricopeptide (TPR) repeat protein